MIRLYGVAPLRGESVDQIHPDNWDRSLLECSAS
jgi:hypothetical protein